MIQIIGLIRGMYAVFLSGRPVMLLTSMSSYVVGSNELRYVYTGNGREGEGEGKGRKGKERNPTPING